MSAYNQPVQTIGKRLPVNKASTGTNESLNLEALCKPIAAKTQPRLDD
jgi:hypothetical protein